MKDQRHPAQTIAIYAFLILTCAIMLFPLIYIFLGSFTTFEEYILTTTLVPTPTSLNTTAYEDVWPFLVGPLISTVFRVTWYVCLGLIVSLFGGYVFSRLDFPGKNFWFMFFLSGLLLPPILMSLPHYMMVARFPLAGGNSILGVGGSGFINEFPSLIVLGMVDVFAMFLVKQSFDMLPREYEEAAKLDGAGFFTIIFRVYAPLLRPALVAVVVIIFVVIWNDYFMPQLLVGGNSDVRPIAVAARLVGQELIRMRGSVGTDTLYPQLFAATVIASMPPLVVYLLLQRYFIQGIASSGLKG